MQGIPGNHDENMHVEFSDVNREEEKTTDAPVSEHNRGTDRESPTGSSLVANKPKSRFWESIGLWSQSTTFHGIHYVTNIQSRAFRRVSWFIFIAVLWVLVIWYCQAQTNRYFEYRTLMLHIIYRHQKIRFPAVSICKLNFVYTASVNSTEKILVEELLKPYPNKSVLVSKFGEQYLNETLMDYNTLLTNHTSEVNDVLLSCKFGGAEFNCSTFNQILSHNGQCFTFNSSPQVELFGDQHGMELLLWLGEDNSFPFDPSSPIFKVVLHDPAEEPNMDTAQIIGAGFTHYVEVDTHQYKYLENPVRAYGGEYCINTKLPEFEHYTIGSCYSVCRQQYTYKQCGCISPYKKGAAGNNCSITKYVDCFKPALLSFMSNKQEQCYCPVPCLMNKYTTSQHSVYLPDRSFTTWNEQLSLNKSLAILKQNLMVIKLFFNNNNVFFHEQTLEYKFEDLWGAFGGVLGSATGASLLSFIEIIDLFLWNLFYHFQNVAALIRGEQPAV